MLFFIGATVLLNSQSPEDSKQQRASAKDTAQPDHQHSDQTAPLAVTKNDTNTDDATLTLEKFHRSETRDGEVVWEIKGTNARIYPQDNSVKINNSHLIFNSESGEPVQISSSKALVYLEGGKLTEAHTSGGVKVVHNNKVTITTDSAVYSAGNSSIHAEGQVFIESDLIETNGVGLDADIEKQEVFLRSKVESVIKPKTGTKESENG